MKARIDVVQEPNLIDIKAYLTKLKKAIRVLTQWVKVAPPSLPSMTLLATIMVDINLLVLNFYP